MKKSILLLAAACAAFTNASAQEPTETLKLELPKPKLDGTAVPVKVPNLETPTKRAPLQVPKGTVNLAAGKTVTSSDSAPVIGDLTFLTDGEKGSDEGFYVELAEGSQWVQVDLGQTSAIYAILFWHFHSQQRAYKDVVVQISDDPDFLSGVTTVFNNDITNASGLGVGKDKAYIDTHEGKLIPVDGVKGRYVRFYSNGNTANPYNHYIEIEVFGKPVS
jgi:hypothetical protein